MGLGFLAAALARCRSWLRVRAKLRAGTPVDLPIAVKAFVTPGVEEPGIVGFVRPVLVLPSGLVQHLNPRELNAILTHELCHVRRRDNLFAAVHMVVEAIFWFHPLIWWIGSRMVKERELACDEEVLRMGCEPADYVEGILKVCRFYVESPLPCISGVTGADVKKRLRAILAGRIARDLNAGKKAILAATGLAVLAVPVLIGVVQTPVIVAQTPVPGTTAPSNPVQATTPEAKTAPSQPQAAPRFDVASIHPCKPDASPAGGRGGGAPGGTLRITCITLRTLIQDAYIRFGDGKNRSPILTALTKMEGGPGWIDSDRYTIEAKSESVEPIPMRAGPMMQALLEDRFQLKVHRETREGLVYELRIAKGGSKVQPAKQGPCVDSDFAGMALPPFAKDDKRPCNMMFNFPKGPNMVSVARSATMENFAVMLTLATGQRVIDKTGINQLIDYRLVYFPEQPIPGRAADAQDAATPDDPPAPSIFTVLEDEMGLKLERARGPREYLVIDRIERPSEN